MPGKISKFSFFLPNATSIHQSLDATIIAEMEDKFCRFLRFRVCLNLDGGKIICERLIFSSPFIGCRKSCMRFLTQKCFRYYFDGYTSTAKNLAN